MKQHTIAQSFSIEGVGLHTGKKTTVTMHPSAANTGITFKRIDLPEQPSIKADVRNVASTTRSTTLKSGEAQVITVEHLLSAMMGMAIDNAVVEVSGSEIPILDGTSQPYVQSILSVGRTEQDADREFFEVTEPFSFKDPETGSEIMALPADSFEATVMIDFDSKVIGPQYASIASMDAYEAELAPCRTFVFLHEVEQLLNMGLIKGGDLDNAIVIADRPVQPETIALLKEKTGKSDVAVGQKGILNTVKLNFQNEPARHKLMDLIGDLSLVGMPIKGKIVATKPGHTVNTAFAKELKRKIIEQRKLKGVPKYDPNAEALYDTMAIAGMLPHRYPFLLVDKIIELSDTHVTGVKNITFNENFFQGHFPNNPVMPGVLQIEAMAQTGGILALSTVPDPGNWDTYFLKMNNVKFKYKVVPGDTLIIKLELLAPIRRGIVQMFGSAYVGKRLVSEGELWAQIVRRKVEEA